MKLRGFGDILGFKQSGEKKFHLADPILHENLFRIAEKEVKRIEEEEIDLSKYKPLIKLYDRADVINDLV
jgi:ATP-dependent DNA helicase RecG